MKKALLITPKSKSIPHLKNVDYIGVDAGSLLILKENLPLQFAVGDFDSMKKEEYETLKQRTTVYKHPIEKDETDSELAVRLCQQMKYDSIVLWGALSGRLDHTLNTIQLLLYRDPHLIVMDENQKVTLLQKGTYSIPNSYKHLSFFAIEESCITVKGVHYPMDHQIVFPSDMYMSSNEFEADSANVYIEYGKILCVESNYI